MEKPDGLILLNQISSNWDDPDTPQKEGSEWCAFLAFLGGIQGYYNKALSEVEIKHIFTQAKGLGVVNPNGYLDYGFDRHIGRLAIESMGKHGRVWQIGQMNVATGDWEFWKTVPEMYQEDFDFVMAERRVGRDGTHWQCCHTNLDLFYDPWPGIDLGPVLKYTAFKVIDIGD